MIEQRTEAMDPEFNFEGVINTCSANAPPSDAIVMEESSLIQENSIRKEHSFEKEFSSFLLKLSLVDSKMKIVLKNKTHTIEVELIPQQLPANLFHLYLNLHNFYLYIIDNIHNPSRVIIQESGMLITALLQIKGRQIKRTVDIPFSRLYQKVQLIKNKDESSPINYSPSIKQLMLHVQYYTSHEQEYLQKISDFLEDYDEAREGEHTFFVKDGILEDELIRIETMKEEEYLEEMRNEEEFINQAIYEEVYDWTVEEYDRILKINPERLIKAVSSSAAMDAILEKNIQNRNSGVAKNIITKITADSTKKQKMKFARQMLKMGFTPAEIIERIEAEKYGQRESANRGRPRKTETTHQFQTKLELLESSQPKILQTSPDLTQKQILQRIVKVLKTKKYNALEDIRRQMLLEGVNISLQNLRKKIVQIREYKKKKVESQLNAIKDRTTQINKSKAENVEEGSN